MTQTRPSSLAGEIERYTAEFVQRIRRDPFYVRFVEGEIGQDEYADWLAQMHRWIHNAIRALHGHADAMAARAQRDRRASPFAVSARRHVEEEIGHDVLLVDDLAALWQVSSDAARGRLERMTAAPAVVDWERLLDGLLARYPFALTGATLAVEEMAGHIVPEMMSGLAKSGIANVGAAQSFLLAHSPDVEEGHTGSARMRIDAITDPLERSAIYFYAIASLSTYEGLLRFLSEKHVVASAEPALSGV